MLFILMPTQKKKVITTRNKKSHCVSLCAGSSSEFDDFGGNHWPGRFSERSRWNPVFLLRVWTLDQGMYVWIQKNTIGEGFFFIFPDTYKNHTPKVLTSNLWNLKMIKVMDTPSSASLLQFFVSFCCWFQDVRLWDGTSGWWWLMVDHLACFTRAFKQFYIFGVGNLTRDVSNAMVNHSPWCFSFELS